MQGSVKSELWFFDCDIWMISETENHEKELRLHHIRIASAAHKRSTGKNTDIGFNWKGYFLGN